AGVLVAWAAALRPNARVRRLLLPLVATLLDRAHRPPGGPCRPSRGAATEHPRPVGTLDGHGRPLALRGARLLAGSGAPGGLRARGRWSSWRVTPVRRLPNCSPCGRCSTSWAVSPGAPSTAGGNCGSPLPA